MTFYLDDEVFVRPDHFFGFGTDTLGLPVCQNFKLRILYILDQIIIQGLSNIYNILNSDRYPYSSETLRNSSYL